MECLDPRAEEDPRLFLPPSPAEFVESLIWAGRWVTPMLSPTIYSIYLDWAKKVKPQIKPLSQGAFAQRLRKIAGSHIMIIPTYNGRPKKMIPCRAWRDAAAATMMEI